MPCMVVESAPVFTPVANRGTVYRPTEALVLSSLHRCLEDVRCHRMHAEVHGCRVCGVVWNNILWLWWCSLFCWCSCG